MKQSRYDDSMLTAPMVIGQIARMHRNLMRESENDNPIMSQNSCRMLLMHLAFDDGVTQLELAQATRLKPPTVSVALKRMESEGYIVRRTDDNDMRAVRVFLTEKGRLLDCANEQRLRETDAVMMEGFSPEESRMLRDLLIRVRNNLAKGNKDE